MEAEIATTTRKPFMIPPRECQRELGEKKLVGRITSLTRASNHRKWRGVNSEFKRSSNSSSVYQSDIRISVDRVHPCLPMLRITAILFQCPKGSRSLICLRAKIGK